MKNLLFIFFSVSTFFSACAIKEEVKKEKIRVINYNSGDIRELDPLIVSTIRDYTPKITENIETQLYNSVKISSENSESIKIHTQESWEQVALWTVMAKALQGGLPAPVVSKWMQWRAGATGNAVYQKSASSSSKSTKYLKKELLQHIPPSFLKSGSYTFAFADYSFQEFKHVVLIIAKNRMHFENFDLTVSADTVLTLSGQFQGEKRIREVYLLRDAEDQKTKRKVIVTDAENRFNFEFTSPAEPGKYYFLVELVSRRNFTKEQKNFQILPLYVSVTPESSPPEAIVEYQENSKKFYQQFITFLNHERIKRELSRVEYQPVLSSIAEQNSQMLQRNRSQDTDYIFDLGDTRQFLARKGIVSRYLTYQFGYSKYLSDFTWEISQSPLFHEQISKANDYKVGFSKQRLKNGSFLYSAMYVQLVGHLDGDQEKDLLFEALNVARENFNFETFEYAHEFQDVADFYAAKVCSEQMVGNEYEKIRETLLPIARYFGYSALFVYREASYFVDKKDMASLAKAIPSSRNRAAISVCQGDIEEFLGGEYVLVVGGEK